MIILPLLDRRLKQSFYDFEMKKEKSFLCQIIAELSMYHNLFQHRNQVDRLKITK